MEFGIFSICSGRPGVDQPVLYRELLDQVELAEDLGFDAFWVGEHHFSTWGTVRNTLLMLAAMGQRTRRIRLGSAVVVLPLHHPLRVAEEAGMVDILTGGRLDLGVGRGARPHESAGFGLDHGDRRARYEEALAVLRRVWERQGPVDFEGRYYQVRGVHVLPRPLQAPHPPIWEAVADPEGIREAARRGHNLLLSSRDTGYEAMVEQIRLFKAAAREASPGGGRVAVANFAFLAESDEAARSEGLRYLNQMYGEGMPENDPLRPPAHAVERFRRMSPDQVSLEFAVETPERMVERIRRLRRDTGDGVDVLLLIPQFGQQGMEPVARTLRLMSQRVFPAVRSAA